VEDVVGEDEGLEVAIDWDILLGVIGVHSVSFFSVRERVGEETSIVLVIIVPLYFTGSSITFDAVKSFTGEIFRVDGMTIVVLSMVLIVAMEVFDGVATGCFVGISDGVNPVATVAGIFLTSERAIAQTSARSSASLIISFSSSSSGTFA